jgi:hypothetical protein
LEHSKYKKEFYFHYKELIARYIPKKCLPKKINEFLAIFESFGAD